MSCAVGGPLSHGSPVVLFDRGHPRFRNFYSTVPVDVVRVKSSVNRFSDHASVPVRITINKLNLIGVRYCGRALERRRSGCGLVGCLGCTPLFWLGLVFQSHRYKLCRIHMEACKLANHVN